MKKGFTLVEVLVAMFLTGLVLAGMVGVWVSSSGFATSERQEIVYKNQLSAGARKILQDVAEATYMNTEQPDCLKGGTRFLLVYKNFLPQTKSCVISDDTMNEATAVFYCFRTDTKKIYREEASWKCDSIPMYDCACATNSDVIASNLVTEPSGLRPTASPVKNLANSVNIRFTGQITVGGKNPRPVTITYDKTFTPVGGNNL